MFSDNDVEKSFVEELKNNSWELKDEKLVKLFRFPSFIRAIDFVNEIAIIAERLDHHPIITINWKTVKLSLKSFDVDGITKRDITLAKEIENLNEQLRTQITAKFKRISYTRFYCIFDIWFQTLSLTMHGM
jgi:4a-hydroxytetrahydrobiopterin dehydratase